MSDPIPESTIMRAARLFLQAPEAGFPAIWMATTGETLSPGRAGQRIRQRVIIALCAIGRGVSRAA